MGDFNNYLKKYLDELSKSIINSNKKQLEKAIRIIWDLLGLKFIKMVKPQVYLIMHQMKHMLLECTNNLKNKGHGKKRQKKRRSNRTPQKMG